MREGIHVREITNDEGRRLLQIVRRSSGSVVRWRRAQMWVTIPGNDHSVEIAECVKTGCGHRTLTILRLSSSRHSCSHNGRKCEQHQATPITIEERPTGRKLGDLWAELEHDARRRFLLASEICACIWLTAALGWKVTHQRSQPRYGLLLPDSPGAATRELSTCGLRVRGRGVHRVRLGLLPAVMERRGLSRLLLWVGFGQQDRALLGRGGPSIDHAMWFHEAIRADEWVLVDLRPLKARAGAARTRVHFAISQGSWAPPSPRSN